MSKDDKAAPKSPTLAVGYKRPPTHTQFKPGRSGDPNGRPKGAKTKRRPITEERLREIILEEAYRSIPVRDGDRIVDIPIAQAVVRSIAVNAAKGQARAQALFTQMLSVTEQAIRAEDEALLKAAINYKEYWEHELAYRARTGATGPEPLPHPDHVVIDPHSGEVRIKGPVTAEEKAEHDVWRRRLEDFEHELAVSRQELARAETQDNPSYRSFLEDDIALSEHLISMVGKAVAYDFKGAAEEARRWKRENPKLVKLAEES